MQAFQVQMDPRAQGMVGMEDEAGLRLELESHMVTCMNLSTLGAEEVAQEGWVEA